MEVAYGPNIWSILQSYAVQIPVVLVWSVGLVMAIANWDKHRKAALLTLVSLGVSILNLTVGGYLSMMIPMRISHSDPSAGYATMMVVTITRYLLSALAWGLILAAVFAGRSLPRSGEYSGSHET